MIKRLVPILATCCLLALPATAENDSGPYWPRWRGPLGTGVAPDATPPVDSGPCFPSQEVCDTSDNDCDGNVDEGFNTSADPQNCGGCGTVCAFASAPASCAGGQCVMGACQVGFHDINNNPSDGCEYACVSTGSEVCDTVDNDCKDYFRWKS